MHKTVLANVNANVGKRMARGVKKNKVTRQALIDVHFLAKATHLHHRTRKLKPLCAIGHVDNQAAAVKATGWSVAPPFIGNANQPNGLNGKIGKTGLTLFSSRLPYHRPRNFYTFDRRGGAPGKPEKKRAHDQTEAEVKP